MPRSLPPWVLSHPAELHPAPLCARLSPVGAVLPAACVPGCVRVHMFAWMCVHVYLCSCMCCVFAYVSVSMRCLCLHVSCGRIYLCSLPQSWIPRLHLARLFPTGETEAGRAHSALGSAHRGGPWGECSLCSPASLVRASPPDLPPAALPTANCTLSPSTPPGSRLQSELVVNFSPAALPS